MLSYRAILKQAWKFSWKNRALWFLGFFASLVSFTVETRIMSRSLDQGAGISSLNNLMMFIKTGIFSADAWKNVASLFRSNPGTMTIITIVFLLVVAISLFFLWLAVSSQIGIIKAVANSEKAGNNPDKKEKIKIKKLLKSSQKKFWPVILFNILISLIVNLIFLLISLLLVVVIIKSQVFASIIYGLIFIIFIPASLFLSFIAKYAIAYVVLENKKIIPALKNAWKLFCKNWLISIEMSIILFFINFIAIVFFSFLSFIIFTLFFGIALSISIMTLPLFLFWIFIIIGFLLVSAIMILGGAWINVFQTTSWVKLFTKLNSGGGSSKLERLFVEK